MPQGWQASSNAQAGRLSGTLDSSSPNGIQIHPKRVELDGGIARRLANSQRDLLRLDGRHKSKMINIASQFGDVIQLMTFANNCDSSCVVL